MSRRVSRMEEACREELSQILLKEIKDPRIGFVTITGVRMSADLRNAIVYVSVLGTEEEAASSLEGLESAKGSLRFRLGRHLRMKFLPEIRFEHERVAESALRISEIMRKDREIEAPDD